MSIIACLLSCIYVGKKSDAIAKEKLYLSGSYTPFHPGKLCLVIILSCSHFEVDATENDASSPGSNTNINRKRKQGTYLGLLTVYSVFLHMLKIL